MTPLQINMIDLTYCKVAGDNWICLNVLKRWNKNKQQTELFSDIGKFGA